MRAIDRIASRVPASVLETLALVIEGMDAQSNDLRWRLVLANNLAIAGGLCRAFDLGIAYTSDLERMSPHAHYATSWWPGCRRAAP